MCGFTNVRMCEFNFHVSNFIPIRIPINTGTHPYIRKLNLC